MFREEARWIWEITKNLHPLPSNNTALNLGSSTKAYREVIQPHIQQFVLLPLKNNGWNIVNVDTKKSDGVDIVADVSKQCLLNILPLSSLTICTNMLEHVSDISVVVKNLLEVTVNGGFILLTVPYKHRRHPDPIDNMFRPTPDEIAALFPAEAINVKEKCIIIIKDKKYHLHTSRFPFWGSRYLVGYYMGIRQKVSGILLKVK
jgi:hypothetical protein